MSRYDIGLSETRKINGENWNCLNYEDSTETRQEAKDLAEKIRAAGHRCRIITRKETFWIAESYYLYSPDAAALDLYYDLMEQKAAVN